MTSDIKAEYAAKDGNYEDAARYRREADFLRPEKMGKAHYFGKFGQRKISRTRARGKCGKSQIDGVCARRQGNLCAGDVPRRG